MYQILHLVSIAVNVYVLILLARGIVTWTNADKTQPGVQFLEKATEPILVPFRNLFPKMGFDLSPIMAIIALLIANRLFTMLIVMLMRPVRYY